MVLVDSSIYIELLRTGKDPVEVLTRDFEPEEIVSCSIVRCEVLRGLVRVETKTYLAAFFDLLVHASMDELAWRQTEELAWDLDRSGKVLPLTDLIIAVCTFRTGASLLTHDRHFELIPALPLANWPVK